MEERALLATVAWDGGGNGTSWNDPLNWDTNALPTAADDVIINAELGDKVDAIFTGVGGAR